MRTNTQTHRLRFSLHSMIDIVSFAVLFLFSTADCVVRLVSFLPYRALGLLLFTGLVCLVCLSATKINPGSTRINLRAALFLILAYLILAFSVLITRGNQREYIKSLFWDISSATKLWVFFFVFSMIRDEKKWNRWLLVLAYVNMTLLVITVQSGLYLNQAGLLNYMGMGLTGTVWVPLIIQKAFLSEGREKTVHIAGAGFFTAFIVIYGNRGSAVAIIAFSIYCVLMYTSVNRKVLIACLLVLLALLVSLYYQVIVLALIQIVNRLGINSRNLTLLLNNQLAYTTHRSDEIWVRVLHAIGEQWWIGYGLTYDRVISGNFDLYTHNLLLEVWLSFGVIIGTVMLIAYAVMGIQLCFHKESPDWTHLFAPFYISATVVLMFNSSFCQLPFFWAPFGVYFAYKKKAGRIEQITWRG